MANHSAHPPPSALRAGATGHLHGEARESLDDAKRRRLERLRWHSRRALLELDIILQRFWDRADSYLDDLATAELEQLLSLEDHDLWDLLSGRADMQDFSLKRMIDRLRQTVAPPGRQETNIST